MTRFVGAGFVPRAVFPGKELPCPLGPGRGKQRPYGSGARKKSRPSLKSRKSQFKQRRPMAADANLNWDYGGFLRFTGFHGPGSTGNGGKPFRLPRKKSCPSLKSQKSQFKQGEP
ncbi:MAG: hypothetical protein ACLFRG_23270, partial [Desulfococcaceae bacterium]